MTQNNQKKGEKELDQGAHSPHLVDLRLEYLKKTTKERKRENRAAFFRSIENSFFKLITSIKKTPRLSWSAGIFLSAYLLSGIKKSILFIFYLPSSVFKKVLAVSMLLSGLVKKTSTASITAIAKISVWPYFLVKNLVKPLFVRPASFKIGRKALTSAEALEKNLASVANDWKEDFSGLAEDVSGRLDKKFRRLSMAKSLAYFVSALLMIILPLKGFSYFASLDDLRVKVMESSAAAIKDLFAAGQSAGKLDFKSAGSDFSEAGKQFASAQNQLSEINFLLFELAKIFPDKKAKLAGNSKLIIEAGGLASGIGADLSAAIDGLLNKSNQGIGASLAAFKRDGSAAADKSIKLQKVVFSIDEESLPVEYRQAFVKLKEQAGLFSSSLTILLEAVDKLEIFVGMEKDNRYLLVFQNNSEIRASGGFFGSFALLDFSRGRIKNLEVPGGGTYDVEAGYKKRIIAPTALHLVNPLWHMWDANWWHDWPTSAEKIAWFYEKSGGSTVDGVISFTPTVIEDFLRVYGSVDMTRDYGVIITPDNFWQVVQTFSEQKQDVTLKPKRIIGDLFQAIIDDLPERLDKELLFKMLLVVENSFDEKQALLHFRDERLNSFVSAYGWDGRVKETSQDYLAVINSSVAGSKSNRDIDELINHKATVLSDGSVIDELEIVHTHKALKGDAFTGQRNVDWLRIYVPQGSELIEAHGFNPPAQEYFEQPDQSWQFDPQLAQEDRDYQLDRVSGTKIYREFGKTVFANWSMIDPQETKRLYLKYRLPFKAKKIIKPDFSEDLASFLGVEGKTVLSYGLLLQKQPGSINSKVVSQLNLDPYLRDNPSELLWSYPQQADFSSQSWRFESDFKKDSYRALLLESK